MEEVSLACTVTAPAWSTVLAAGSDWFCPRLASRVCRVRFVDSAPEPLRAMPTWLAKPRAAAKLST